MLIAMRNCKPHTAPDAINEMSSLAKEGNMQERPDLHVVLGAGQVGPLLAERLLALGYRVRMVRRGPPTSSVQSVEWLHGDLTDARFAERACAGASVVYNCTNPQLYHRWDELLMPLCRGILNATAHAGARLVVLDNLYMVGAPEKVPFDESAPMKPLSTKGELRRRLVDEYTEAHARGLVQWTSGRAADYFGPGAGAMSAFGDHLAERFAKRRAVEVFGNPKLPRSYSYIPDVARGLAVLGTRQESWGHVWHLPVAWSGSTEELVFALAQELGEPARLMRVTDLMLRAIGIFSPMIGAMREMTYQWKAPFVVDDRRFRETFGEQATAADEAIRQSAAALRVRIEEIRKSPKGKTTTAHHG